MAFWGGCLYNYDLLAHFDGHDYSLSSTLLILKLLTTFRFSTSFTFHDHHRVYLHSIRLTPTSPLTPKMPKFLSKRPKASQVAENTYVCKRRLQISARTSPLPRPLNSTTGIDLFDFYPPKEHLPLLVLESPPRPFGMCTGLARGGLLKSWRSKSFLKHESRGFCGRFGVVIVLLFLVVISVAAVTEIW